MRLLLLAVATTTVGLSFLGHLIVEAGTEEVWPANTPNSCLNPGDYFNDFEVGVDGVEIEASNPGILFSNTDGLDWVYGDVTVPGYNVNNPPDNDYATNGNNFAWLGQEGDIGRIDFLTRTATYVSILTSSAGLNLVAFDRDDNEVDSISTGDSRGTGQMVRLTVTAAEIAYVHVFDSGNFWLIDDLCTDFQPPECLVVPGRELGPLSRRINVVFIQDVDYDAGENFLDDVNEQIDQRLLAAPIPGSDPADVFNFLYSPDLQADSDEGAGGAWEVGVSCGTAILPDNFADFCAFDVAVVLHTQEFLDCSSGGVIGAEAAIGRSLIHEVRGNCFVFHSILLIVFRVTTRIASFFLINFFVPFICMSPQIGHAAFGLSDEYDDAPGCNTGYSTNNNV